MKGPVTASGRDLHTLAGIVSDDRGDPPAEGLVPSLLSDLLGLIRCDYLVFEGHDSSQQLDWFGQAVPDVDPDGGAPFWEHYWDDLPCSYADLTGDVRRVTTISDFYSARQWHSSGMYCDCFRPRSTIRSWCACPLTPGGPPGPAGPCDSSSSAGPAPISPNATATCSPCCARTCTRPTSTPNAAATPPQAHRPARELLHLVAAGHTNAQIARRLGISEGTVRTHLENIYRLLQVSSRTAAVTRAFADRTG